MMKAFLDKINSYPGSYTNVRWRSESQPRTWGCCELPQDTDKIIHHIEQLATDWYVTCNNDAGYYMQAIDVDHTDPIEHEVLPDYSLLTSPRRRQFIWFLDEQIDSETWLLEQIRLVKMYKGDFGSTHPLFFARIPYTFNYKRNCEIVDDPNS